MDIFIKHFKNAEFPWKIYFKDPESHLSLQIGGCLDYYGAKLCLFNYKRTYELNHLMERHRSMLRCITDSEYLVLK